MKQKCRLVVLFVLTGLLAFAAIWLALRFGWFRSNTAPVILPETTAALPGGDESRPGGPMAAEVTPETVQAVVGTLIRPDSYARTLRVESFWSGGGQAWDVQVWQKSSLTRIRIEAGSGDLPVKLIQTDGETVLLWHEGREDAVVEYRISDPALSDTLQMLPTYEDLLRLDPSQIESAGYVRHGGAWRIMAAVREEPTGFRMVYYISIETGLLEAAERRDGDTLLYRMTADTADLAAPEDEQFFFRSEATGS